MPLKFRLRIMRHAYLAGQEALCVLWGQLLSKTTKCSNHKSMVRSKEHFWKICQQIGSKCCQVIYLTRILKFWKTFKRLETRSHKCLCHFKILAEWRVLIRFRSTKKWVETISRQPYTTSHLLTSTCSRCQKFLLLSHCRIRFKWAPRIIRQISLLEMRGKITLKETTFSNKIQIRSNKLRVKLPNSRHLRNSTQRNGQ